MKSLLQFTFQVSRFRFWGYLAGPYVIGYVIGIQTQNELVNSNFLIHLIYFLVCANILIYGVNDFFDTETDKYNTKKNSYEHSLHSAQKKPLLIILAAALIITIAIFMLQKSLQSQLFFSFFIFLAIFYSAPPLRFKAWPFIDSASNILYAIPAFLAYNQATGMLPTTPVVIGAFCWTAAMHLFSAIPDIQPDKKAGIITSAVLLGAKPSLVICAVLWSITAFIAVQHLILFPWSLLMLVYPAIPMYLITNRDLIPKVYRAFPYVTMTLGALLFFVFFLIKPYA